jgi:hypothetical protein
MQQILIFLATLLITLVTSFSPAPTMAESDAQQVYISYATPNQSLMNLSRSTNFDLARNAPRQSKINIDLMSGSSIQNIYSNTANRANLQGLDSYLKEPTPSDDPAFISSVKRIEGIAKTGVPTTAYLIYPGTSNKRSLAIVNQVANDIARLKPRRLKIYLLGLSPDTKIGTVAAFKPIANNLMGSCTATYSHCRDFVFAVR